MDTIGYDEMLIPPAISVEPGINWLLIGIIGGCFIIGLVIGIILGRRAMKKRDI